MLIICCCAGSGSVCVLWLWLSLRPAQLADAPLHTLLSRARAAKKLTKEEQKAATAAKRAALAEKKAAEKAMKAQIAAARGETVPGEEAKEGENGEDGEAYEKNYDEGSSSTADAKKDDKKPKGKGKKGKDEAVDVTDGGGQQVDEGTLKFAVCTGNLASRKDSKDVKIQGAALRSTAAVRRATAAASGGAAAAWHSSTHAADAGNRRKETCCGRLLWLTLAAPLCLSRLPQPSRSRSSARCSSRTRHSS